MIKYLLVILLLLWVPNTSCDAKSYAASEPISELSMLIEISKSVSSIQTNLIQIDKSADEIKKDVSNVQVVVNDTIVKLKELEINQTKSESSFIDLKNQVDKLQERTQTSDLTNMKQDTSASIVVGILVFIGCAIFGVLFNYVFNKLIDKKKK